MADYIMQYPQNGFTCMLLFCLSLLLMFPPSVLLTHLLPPLYSDANLIVQNIFQATSNVDYDVLSNFLEIPGSVYLQITDNLSDPTDKKREAMIVYYLNTIPCASWSTLAAALYYWEKQISLDAVRKYLHCTTG